MHCFAVICEVSCEVFPDTYFGDVFSNSGSKSTDIGRFIPILRNIIFDDDFFFDKNVFFSKKKNFFQKKAREKRKKWFKRHSCNKIVAAFAFL